MKYDVADQAAKHYLSCIYNDLLNIEEVLESIHLISIYLFTNIVPEKYTDISENAKKLSDILYNSIEDEKFTLVELEIATTILMRTIIRMVEKEKERNAK